VGGAATRETESCQLYRSNPVRTTAPAGAEAVMCIAIGAGAPAAYWVGRRICRKVNVFRSRNIGVRGGSNDGVRNSSSNLYWRFGGP
jgi:hypothetical protein